MYHHHPVIALALAKQRAAMFEQEAAESALVASIRAELRAEERPKPRRWRRSRRRRVATPRPVG